MVKIGDSVSPMRPGNVFDRGRVFTVEYVAYNGIVYVSCEGCSACSRNMRPAHSREFPPDTDFFIYPPQE